MVLLVGSSEEFFLDFPKKALKEFFQSLKAKKTLPKMSHVRHYHMHYMPMPLPLLAWKAPDKYYLDELYGDSLASFGWSDYGYRYMPDPSMIVPSGLQHLSEPDPWDDLWHEDFLGTDDDDDVYDTIDRSSNRLLVHTRQPIRVPFAMEEIAAEMIAEDLKTHRKSHV
ncbi:hypothetical protein PUN28_016437 [Cardiocondyla obscurior]